VERRKEAPDLAGNPCVFIASPVSCEVERVEDSISKAPARASVLHNVAGLGGSPCSEPLTLVDRRLTLGTIKKENTQRLLAKHPGSALRNRWEGTRSWASPPKQCAVKT
jgi:Mg/Co/Ni transporter MgtE